MSHPPQYRVRGRGRHYSRSQHACNEGARNSRYPGVPVAKIPLLRHDGYCCREVTINLELDESHSNYFAELKKLWNMLKNSPPVIHMLHNYFNHVENPYIEALRLLYNCQDFKNAKNKTMPLFIMEEFKNWSITSRNKIIHLLTGQLQIDTFKVISKQNALPLTKLVIEAYEMVQNGTIFLDIIKCMLEKNQYKDACQFATLLKLHDKFTIDDFLLPLIMQDKLNFVDDFLRGSPRHQTELIVFLDSVLGKSSVREALGDYINTHKIPEVKFEKLHPKPWKKMISRFLKMFKLPSDLTPNLNKRRNEGALNFLLHKRFVENSFSDESWKEMVQEAVGDDEEMQKELVEQVNWYGDAAEALRWAHFYNIDKQYWPTSVRLLYEDPDGTKHHQRHVPVPLEEESWDNEIKPAELVEYHRFTLPFNKIHLIDSIMTFENFLDTGLQDIDVVGIDCEWKPSFGSSMSELALMQIATRQNVFVLDIINLGNKAPHLWQELGKFLFNNCDILKLGFSLTNDISIIKHALPELNFSTKQVGFLDLCSLWKQLDKYPKVVLPFEVQKGGPSLTTLVHHCLGHPLDKSDQFSNWEKRPLRESQLIYAALDAYCLIEVYDVLKRCCESGEFPFEEVCYNLMTNEKMHKRKPRKTASKKQSQPPPELPQPPSPHPQPIPANYLKIVCDTSLQGLGRNLRRCGVDAAILGNDQDHMECVRYAIDEERYIVTRGSAFNKLCGSVPQGHCLKIISDDVDEQLKEVLSYYKVLVTKDHVFSRCQACNGNNFIKVCQSTMHALAKSLQEKQCPPPPCYFEDEATGFSSEDDDFEEAGQPISYSRKWELYPDEKLDIGLCRTKLGAQIQVQSIPEGILTKYDFFYVCEECGKVYWDGSHFERVLTGRLQGIVA